MQRRRLLGAIAGQLDGGFQVRRARPLQRGGIQGGAVTQCGAYTRVAGAALDAQVARSGQRAARIRDGTGGGGRRASSAEKGARQIHSRGEQLAPCCDCRRGLQAQGAISSSRTASARAGSCSSVLKDTRIIGCAPVFLKACAVPGGNSKRQASPAGTCRSSMLSPTR